MSQVRLIKAVRLPASYAVVVPVQVAQAKGTILLEPSKSLNQALQVEESLLEVKEDGSTTVVIVNNSNSSCQLKKGMELGQAIGADVIDHVQQESLPTQQSSSTDTGLSAESEVIQQLPEGLNVFGVSVPTSTSSKHVNWRQCQLGNLLRSTKGQLSEEHHLLLKALLSEYYDVFSLEEDE